MENNIIGGPDLTFRQKLWKIHWAFVFMLVAMASVGFAMLYSAANGDAEPWANRHAIRFAFGLAMMIGIALIDIRIWLRYAYVIYFSVLLLLVAVDIGGFMGMGAQRWVNLGFFNLQPSELMKIAMVLALARYFHGGSIEDIPRIRFLLVPLMIVAAPMALVLRQPDLGTALILLITGAGLFFVAGVRLWKFGLLGLVGLLSAPIAWQFMHDYQRRRVLTFLDPESDPLGAGYHIIQSKIAFGSGGLSGRGFMQGTQGHLNFLPEMQTDFIFTMLAEEFGLIGALLLLTLYILMLIYGIAIALRSRSHFGCLLAMGVTSTFFLYVFINIAMVMGLIPVVGVPLPLISYGGTAMMALLFGFGLLMGVSVHSDVMIGRRGATSEG